MLLSHKNKWIFIHEPKTGGTSIAQLLRPHCDVEGIHAPQIRDPNIPLGPKQSKDYKQHDTLQKVNETLMSQNYDPGEYFSFCFVRNPWDALVSLYHYYHKLVETVQNPMQNAINVVTNCKTFDDFLKSSYWGPTRSGAWKDYYEQNIRLMSYVCKFENIQQDFDTVCDKIGIPQQQLSHKNKSKHKHYTEYYNDETKQIVATRRAQFIEHFEYKFGE